MSNDPAREELLRYFSQNGLLLCNENTELPYLDLVGGSWNAIVSLMESGDVFYSRFYKDRVTYLSRELYLALKPYRRRAERLSAQSERLLAFLQTAGEATAEQMQNTCMLEKKAQTETLNALVSELFVTVLRRDVTIHESWCTFCYGTAERWEEKRAQTIHETNEGEAEQILLRQLSQKQVNALLRSRGR
ncbi:MAG: hypothetical protein VB061_09705 [Christensenella sp.]|nr:hypothetical protein [Christensenella sp.]